MAHARHHPSRSSHSRLEEQVIPMRRTVGDVKAYLRQDFNHELVMGLVRIPAVRQPYINHFTELLHRIADDNKMSVSGLAELDDNLDLTPEAEALFTRLREKVKIIADTL